MSAPSLPPNIGSYRVLRKIGEGGMGAVYEAEQENPRRRVALKVLAAGILSDQLVRRFELEAHVLGLLHHPGIAQIFEAGQYDAGNGVQPFFAMEYIQGANVLEYAEMHSLDLAARVELLAKICDAVHHAHLRGVVHRDLKPGNILVTSEGEPKVLDFGIARATDADIRTTTLMTDVGQIVGTIPYMSPEQASGDPDQIDARSDVYSLGVVGYQLVSGRMPYAVDGVLLHEAVRVVREVDPTPLSSFDRELRGDAETIIGKALEKESGRRYSSASALASDLRRYLNHEPIEARPPSAFYQLGKFAHRNKTLVGAVVAVLVTLVIGLIGTSYGYFEAKAKAHEAFLAQQAADRNAEAARESAEDAKRSQEQAEKNAELAQEEATRANQTTDFLMDMLGSIHPDVAQGLDTKLMRMILDGTEERIDGELSGLPLVEAQIRQSLGQAYLSISEHELGFEHYSKAAEIQTAELGPLHPETITTRLSVGSALARVDVAQAVQVAEELFEEVKGEYDEDHPSFDEVRGFLGANYVTLKQLERAEELLEPSYEYRLREYGLGDESTLIMVNSLGLLRAYQDRQEEAEALLKTAYEQYLEQDGETNSNTILLLQNLAGLYREANRLEDAQAYLERVVEDGKAILGVEHPTTLRAMEAFADLANDRRMDMDRGLRMMEEVVETRRRVWGVDHPATNGSERVLANLLIDNERYDEALTVRRRLFEEHSRRSGSGSKATLIAKGELATAFELVGRADEAFRMRLELAEDMRVHLGENDRSTLTLSNDIGIAYMQREDWDLAEQYFDASLRGRRSVLGDKHPNTLISLYCITSLNLRRKDWFGVVAPGAEFVAGWGEVNSREHSWTVSAARNVVSCAESSEPLASHEPDLRTVVEHYRLVEDPGAYLGRALGVHAESLVASGRLEEALPLFEEAEKLMTAQLEAIDERADIDPRSALRGHATIGVARFHLGLGDRGEEYMIEAFEGLPQYPAHGRRLAGYLAALYEERGDSAEAAMWRERASSD